jgi:hypothetical protein
LDYLTTHTSLSPTRRDKVYQLLAHGGWFSPASSTTKIGRHYIAEITLSGIKHQKSKSSITCMKAQKDFI